MEIKKEKIPNEKFSNITVFENGIRLTAITGVIDPKNNIYKCAGYLFKSRRYTRIN